MQIGVHNGAETVKCVKQNRILGHERGTIGNKIAAKWSDPRPPLKIIYDVFCYRIGNGIPGYTTRVPPLARGDMVRSGNQTVISPTP